MDLLLLAFLATAAADAGHEQRNPIYRELRQGGVAVSPTIKVPLPEPTMADGLDAQAQEAVLKKLAGNDYAIEDLARKSVVAPHILRLRDIHPSDPQAPARGVDTWFIAYGDLKTLQKKEFMEQMLSTGKKQGNGRELTGQDLKKRGLTMGQGKNEGYGHIVFPLFDKVEISATGRSFLSQTDHSIVAATRLEPGFSKDAEFPNHWRPLLRGEDGKVKPGPAQPYEGSAFYVKVTRLAQPASALFVEVHVVFAEPHGWFDGANYLRSKLPLAVQRNVHTLRRELMRASP